MLRRTRYVLPILITAAALVGRQDAVPLPVLLLICVVAGIAADLVLTRVSERRLQSVADQVTNLAADVQQPVTFHTTGGPEWVRLITALQQVGEILQDRFAALQAERERGERVLDSLPSAVLLFADGLLAYANPVARDMFSLPAELGLMTPLKAMGVAGLAGAVEEIVVTGQEVVVQVGRDGRLLSAAGRLVAAGQVALIVTDQTEVHRVEAMRRDFVANASHELKTPVTGVQALADSLEMAMDRDPDRARVMAQRIQTEATRMARLVRELLDLTRLEEGGSAAARQRIEVGALARQVVTRLRDIAEAAQVTVEVSAAEEAHIVGILEDVRLVIRNLVMNAIAYNLPGGRVEVSVDKHGGRVELTVSDDGIGIPEASHDRIFERFYRVDKARSRAVGGTGLGLSMVRNAVEAHGGSVRVRSVLGEGSTFVVDLPVDGGM